MKIEYKSTALKTELIELEDAIDIRINGIKITETKDGINLNCDRRIIIKGVATNSLDVSQEEF